jgi:hypothetical protein
VTRERFQPRELALAGLFGAAALALPFLFHLVQLGRVFLPMYLPLMALAFFASPAVVAATAFVVPLLSALLTGMPPWYPPVAPIMSLELAVMSALAAFIWRRTGKRKWTILAVLAPVLVLGRGMQLVMGYLLGLMLDLPPEFLSLASVAAGFPGLILMCVVIPALVMAVKKNGTRLEEAA